jgi:hypothetical protein
VLQRWLLLSSRLDDTNPDIDLERRAQSLSRQPALLVKFGLSILNRKSSHPNATQQETPSESGWMRDPCEDQWVGDIGASPKYGPTLTNGYVPCLTRARCGSSGYWLFSHGRPLNVREMLRLQVCWKLEAAWARQAISGPTRPSIEGPFRARRALRALHAYYRPVGPVNDWLADCLMEWSGW